MDMKRFMTKTLLLAALVAFFGGCKNNDTDKEPETKVNYDLLVGTWTLNQYNVVIVNLDENKELQNISRNKGTLTVTKKTDDENEVHYCYTEDFINPDYGTYSGEFILDNKTNRIELAGKDGFMRSDNADVYDMDLKVLTDTKMEWSYVRTHTHSRTNEVPFQEKITLTATFTKNK